MENRLVTTCIHILNLIPVSGLNVNKIIQQTSRDREYVIDTIRVLKRAKVVQHDHWNPGKRKIIKATGLGQEIKALIDGINKYYESYSKFLTTSRITFEENEIETLVEQHKDYSWFRIETNEHRLRAQNWTEAEIKKFREWTNASNAVAVMCLRNIMLALLYKFVLILYRYNPNEITKKIITEIILSAINKELELHKDIKMPTSETGVESKTVGFLCGIHFLISYEIESFYKAGHYISSCRFISKDVRNLVKSLYALLNTDDIMLRKRVDFHNRITSEDIECLDQSVQKDSTEGLMKSKDYRELLDILNND